MDSSTPERDRELRNCKEFMALLPAKGGVLDGFVAVLLPATVTVIRNALFSVIARLQFLEYNSHGCIFLIDSVFSEKP